VKSGGTYSYHYSFKGFSYGSQTLSQLYYVAHSHICISHIYYKHYIVTWSIALCSAETWTLREVIRNTWKVFKFFEMCWRRMEKISWTDHVGNEEVLLRVKEQRNILHEISKWKANWIGHILRRNCLLQQVIEGKIKRE
jgi:hypothetical protein